MRELIPCYRDLSLRKQFKAGWFQNGGIWIWTCYLSVDATITRWVRNSLLLGAHACPQLCLPYIPPLLTPIYASIYICPNASPPHWILYPTLLSVLQNHISRYIILSLCDNNCSPRIIFILIENSSYCARMFLYFSSNGRLDKSISLFSFPFLLNIPHSNCCWKFGDPQSEILEDNALLLFIQVVAL